MRNSLALHYIYSYSALEKAIESACRRYFLARNPKYAAGNDEVLQAKKDSVYRPGFFHGETGNRRALNTLMQLHELPEDKTSFEYKKNCY